MFSLWATVLSFITRQMGLRTDAADAAGSLHAKVKEGKEALISYMDTELPKLQKPRGPVSGKESFFTNTASVYVTALNVTGKGRLVALGVQNAASFLHALRVTIDTYVFQFETPSATGYFYPAPPYVYTNTAALDTVANGGRPDMFSIPFKTSLKIETYSTSTSYRYVYWIYVKE